MKRRVINIIEDKKGFTTLHNIMITVIILMLAAVGLYAFYGYISTSYNIKACNTAQKVFDAAQDYLNEIVLQDRLKQFNESSARFGGSIKTLEYRPALQSVYKGTDFEQFFQEFQKNYNDKTIRYILLESSKNEKGNREQNPILEMLDLRIPDDNIIKNSFLIEYNSETGEVLAAFYSEKTDTFSYEDKTELKTNVILRDSNSLRSKWQGYYGLDVEDL